MLQLALEHADNSPLTTAAEKWVAEGRCTWPLLYNPKRPAEVVPGSYVVLEGTERSIGAGFCPDGCLIVCFSDHLELWQADGLKLARLPTEGCVVMALGLRNGHLLLSYLDGSLHLLDEEGIPQFIIEAGDCGSEGLLELEDGRLLGWAENQARIWNRQGKLLSVLRSHLIPITAVWQEADGTLVTSSPELPRLVRRRNGWPVNPLAVVAGWVRGFLFVLLELAGVNTASRLVQREWRDRKRGV